MTTDSSTGDWTPERIREARERCERATPGPWEIEREECYEPDFDDEEPLGYPRRIGPIESWDHAQGGRGTDESAAIVEADAAFISHAREDLPAALAWGEQQAREIEALRANLQSVLGSACRRAEELAAERDGKVAEIERLTAELAARAPADASLDARAKIDAPADLARALAEAHRIVRHESAIRDGETLVWVLPILLRAVDASRPGLTEEQAQIARAEPAIAAWLDYFAAMDRQHKSGTAADARIVRDLRAKANGMDRFVADVVYHVALARHRASRGETGPAAPPPGSGVLVPHPANVLATRAALEAALHDPDTAEGAAALLADLEAP